MRRGHSPRCSRHSKTYLLIYRRMLICRLSFHTPSLPSGIFNWLPSLWAIPDTFVLSHQGLDSYFFLRFLKISVIACLVGCCVIWPVLLPVHATGGAKQTQLDLLTMSNVKNEWRFFAHAGCAWIYFCKFPRIGPSYADCPRLSYVSYHTRKHVLCQGPTCLPHAAFACVKAVFAHCSLHVSPSRLSKRSQGSPPPRPASSSSVVSDSH